MEKKINMNGEKPKRSYKVEREIHIINLKKFINTILKTNDNANNTNRNDS